MHAGQVDLAEADVAVLVASQFPAWAGLDVRRVPSTGTVNALYRIGPDLVARLPLVLPADPASARRDLEAEHRHARLFARHLPIAVPEPVAIAPAGPGYAAPWSIYRWVRGETAEAADRHIASADGLAEDLAALVRAVRSIPVTVVRRSPNGRGGPLRELDAEVRGALAELAQGPERLADGPLLERWTDAVRAPAAERPVVLHADLMPGNLLVRDGRLTGLLDLEAVTVGDPAVDLMPAWNLLPPPGRERFRRDLDVPDDDWRRGRGAAIAQAAIALPYYRLTNPAMAAHARRTLSAVLDA